MTRQTPARENDPPRRAPRDAPAQGRRRLDQWMRNPDCEANARSALLGVSLRDVAVADGVSPSFGQSRLALAHGNRFEDRLLRDGAARLIAALRDAGVVSSDQPMRFRDLRPHRGAAGSVERAEALTAETLREIAHDPATAPTLIAAPRLALPLPGWETVTLVLDALLVDVAASPCRLRVVEVKSYPDCGGHTSRESLAGTRAQAGLYVHALRALAAAPPYGDALAVDSRAVFVLARPGSMNPSVRAHEDLEYAARAAERGLARLAELARALSSEWRSTASDADRVAAVQAGATRYCEACLSFCDRAPLCAQRAWHTESAAALGDEVARLVGDDLPLSRTAELLAGAPPTNEAEAVVLERLGGPQ